mgnify:CR=1 FL=1
MLQYISPIHLFEHCGIESSQLPQTDVSRIKKIVMAEFALSPNGFITVDKNEYSKDFVLQELDDPDFNERLTHHLTVWNNAGINGFLLYHHIEMIGAARREWGNLADNQYFVDFISPYFTFSFNKFMGYTIKQQSFRNASRLIDFLIFINPVDYDDAFKSSRIFLQENISILKNLNAESYKSRLRELTPWRDSDWHLFVDKLPDDFYTYKVQLAEILINLTVEVYKKDTQLALDISSNLIGLNGLPTEFANLIKNNHKVFKTSHNGQADENKGCMTVRLIFFILIALSTIVRTCA